MCVVCDQIRARVTSILVMRVHVYVYSLTVHREKSHNTEHINFGKREKVVYRIKNEPSTAPAELTAPGLLAQSSEDRAGTQRQSTDIPALQGHTTHVANSQKKGHVHVSIAELLQPFGLTPRVFDRARDRAH